MPNRRLLDRLLRFIASGASATGFHWLLMWLLIVVGMHPTTATACGAASGAAANYLLQRNWTFRSKTRHGFALPRFAGAAVLAWLANLGLFTALHITAGLGAAPAQVLTTASVAVLTYFFYSRLVFHETAA